VTPRPSVAPAAPEAAAAPARPRHAPARPALVVPRPRHALYEPLATGLHAAAALGGLVFLSPLFAVVALLVKLTSPGPVFYRGQRVGRGGRLFRIYKFRTMVDGAETEIGGRLASAEDKTRLCTPLGRLLKRTKLDELPQLLNVLRGEMRLVGPRPVRPVFLAELEAALPRYRQRFGVPPGMTGIAQLRGGYYTPDRNKLRYDLVYIRNRSLWLDAQIVALTFVKVLNRWLSRGLLVLFALLFVSFLPADVQPALRVPLVERRLNLVTLLVVAVTAWLLLRRTPPRVSLYRCPLNVPVILFVALNGVAALLSEDPLRVLRGSGYYVVTGFLTAFVIVNTLASVSFVRLAARAIGLTSAAVSLLGLLEVFLANQGGAGALRASSIVGSPVALAVYLVLGIPLLLAEVALARTQRARDFWLVCATVSFVGTFFTQSRVGLLALLVAGTVFLSRRRAQALAFGAIVLAGALLLVSLGSARFAPAAVKGEVEAWVASRTFLLQRPLHQWLVGAGPARTSALVAEASAAGARPARPQDVAIDNMHVTLLLEHGLLGWGVIMWLILSALAAMKYAHDRLRDERLRTLLWAIVSSVVGYLVSMNSMNTFHHLAIQVYSWALIGLGLGLVTHATGARWPNLIWRFGDPGD